MKRPKRIKGKCGKFSFIQDDPMMQSQIHMSCERDDNYYFVCDKHDIEMTYVEVCKTCPYLDPTRYKDIEYI